MPATDDHEKDPFEGLKLDEDFIQGAEHKEQSARARMLSARWKRTPPQDTGWRVPVTPVKKRRRRWQAPLFVLLAVGLVAASLDAHAIHDWAFGKAPGAQAEQSVVPALTSNPTAAPPTPMVDDQPSIQDPFAGSPALHWPSGTAGIVLPAAKPEGIFPASTVASDEQLVRTFLVAAYLDPKDIAGGYPQNVLDLLNQEQRDWMSTALAHPTAKQNALLWVSRFNPKTAVPIGDTVKVQGFVSLSGDADNGLLVHTDFTFVYASHPADGADEVERSIARRTLDFRFVDPNRYTATPGLVMISHTKGFTGDQRCDSTDGYLLPYFQLASPTSTASGPTPSGTPVDPYDMSKPISDKQSDCALDSRS